MTEVAPQPLQKLESVDLAATETEQNENTTVFHDPQAFTVKHPLINKWTLWYTKPPTPGQRGADAWADNLKEVITFDSVEEFWGCAECFFLMPAVLTKLESTTISQRQLSFRKNQIITCSNRACAQNGKTSRIKREENGHSSQREHRRSTSTTCGYTRYVWLCHDLIHIV